MALVQAFKLSQVRPGQMVRITSVAACAGLACRIREMGLLEGRAVRVVSAGNPLICQVGHCRLGLCRRLANAIQVQAEPIAEPRHAPADQPAVTTHSLAVPIEQ